MSLDTQSIEIIGRGRLVEQLLLGNVEVAVPTRDRGIDLIAYLDLGVSFVACPIQLKAATGRAFSISGKYAKFPSLIHAFVWNITGEKTEIYALTQLQAIEVAEQMGYTKTQSWLEDERYAVTKISDGLLDRFQPYLMTSHRWQDTIVAAMPPC